ncbi:putative protease inhibitor [Gigaspora margarita]|uniref:Putative protease inhibitor n=1 Tax=Gigaspora margarita TaxID=4874 RepID=A0A8H3XKL4_GIGMA|nr:putative protease inhibitor [Gigaspora margarita]
MSLRRKDKFAIFFFLSILTFAAVCIVTANYGPIDNEKPSTQKYIIVLRNDVSDNDMESLERYLLGLNAHIYKVYNSTIMKGFAVEMPEEYVSALSEDKNVQFVEPDQTVSINSKG